MIHATLERERVKLAEETLTELAPSTVTLDDWHSTQWLCSIPTFQSIGVRFHEEEEEASPEFTGKVLGLLVTLRGYPAIMKLFGITLGQAESLFGPRGASCYDEDGMDLNDQELLLHRFREFLKDCANG